MIKEYYYFCRHFHSYTSDITLLKLIPQPDNRLEYVPGQFVEAIFDKGLVLPLSIANTPSHDGELEFHLRHNKNHVIAEQFLTALKKDNRVILRGPFGNSVLTRANGSNKIIFLAGGTGFTPIKALLEAALFHESLGRVIELYWGIRQPQDAYKLSLLEEWQKQFPLFSFHLVLSEPSHFPTWQGACGLVHEFVASLYPSFEEEVIFASGPYPMIKAALSLLSQQGLKKVQFITDMLID